MSPPTGGRDNPGYDRARAEDYWGDERRRLGEDLRIVLSAGEPHFVNVAYHLWETGSLVSGLGKMRGLRVLDLACGLGRVSRVLAEGGANVIGVDNAFAMLQTSKRKSRNWKLPGTKKRRSIPSWLQGTSSALPFDKESFDVVVCFGLLEHLPRDHQQGTLREAMRVLKRGGALYLVLNNDQSILLRSGQDNKHRKAQQLANGYYCGLVNRATLMRLLRSREGRVETMGSNAHYSLLRHGLREKISTPVEKRYARDAFLKATERDLEEPNQDWLGDACADHFLYRITKVMPGSAGKKSRRVRR